MVTVSPFRGLRYAPAWVAPSVYAPPYDVIDAQQRLAYLAGNPHNILNIDLGPGSEPAWYAEARRIRDAWLTEGALVRDPNPAFYGYLQRFEFDGQMLERAGFLAAVRLVEWGQGIYPHERTRVGPRQDRLNLMRALNTQNSPVFGLYHDATDALGSWLNPPAQVDVDVTDAESVRHLFWVISDPDAIDGLTTGMARREIVIADGHHRYETALAYRDERRVADGPLAEPRAYDNVLMYLCPLESPGLRVLATHRVVHAHLADAAALLEALQHDFFLTRHESDARLSDLLKTTPQDEIAFGLCLGTAGNWLLRLKDLGRAIHAAAGLPPETATLDVCVLQNLIFAPLLGISNEALAKRDVVSYTVYEHEACASVRAGQAQAAFMLNPTRLDRVWAAATAGVTMPQKSTYFWPKLLTGLVQHPLD